MAASKVTISNARQKFFDLFQAVLSRHGRKVIITSRGASGHAVLVAESYLNELEAAARRLRELEAGQGLPAASFKLLGSGRILGDLEDPITRLRLEAAAAAEQKLTTLTKVT